MRTLKLTLIRPERVIRCGNPFVPILSYVDGVVFPAERFGVVKSQEASVHGRIGDGIELTLPVAATAMSLRQCEWMRLRAAKGYWKQKTTQF